MKRGRSSRGWMAAVVLAAASGCAPTTMSPMVLRLAQPRPQTLGGGAGLRSGPRISAPNATQSGAFEYQGDSSPFSLPQWSVAYDFVLSYAFDHAWEAHFGAQGELAFPLPIPGYGLYAGVSRRFSSGALAVTPALCVRGATDFGISSFGGPASTAGVELSSTFALTADPKLVLGIAPFAQLQGVWNLDRHEQALYVGAAAAARIDYGIEGLEISAGFGRVFIQDGPAWNAPILGIRLTR